MRESLTSRACFRVTLLLLLPGIAACMGAAQLRANIARTYDENARLATSKASENYAPSIFAAAQNTPAVEPSKLDQHREQISSQESNEETSAAEQWILTQVNNAEYADLMKHFPNEADRVIDSTFVKKLLTGRYSPRVTVQPYGVHISNARIVGILNLVNHEFPYDVSFRNCLFEKEVYLNGAHFKGSSLDLQGTTFKSPTEFTYLKTGKGLSLENAVFDAPAVFYGADIAGNLSANNTHFNDTKLLSFERVKIGGYFFLNGAHFNGEARFYRASVTDNLEAARAEFCESAQLTNFQNMRIEGHVFLRRAFFAGPVSFNSTTVGGVFEAGNNEGGATFMHEAVFSNMTADAIGFQSADFFGPIVLREMKYNRMSTSTPQDILSILNHSAYESGGYAQLEQYCRHIGDLDQADEVYMDKRRRERGQLSFGSSLGNLMLDWLVGYGRRPWRTLLWSAAIVLGAGLFIFRKSDMQAKDPKNHSGHYSRFLYSLDLLLPIVDLQSASNWTPKPESRLPRRYLPIHVILGWILATILAGTLTGLLK